MPLIRPTSSSGSTFGPHQVEDQEHLGGPAADAADADQLLDDRLVVHLLPGATWTAPDSKCSARSRRYSTLRADSPAARMRRRSSASTAAGARRVDGPAVSAAKRSQTDCAAFTEICWPTMERASVVKASPRLCSRPSPNCGISLLHHAVALGQVLAGIVPVVGDDAAAARVAVATLSAFTQVVPCGESLQHDALRQQLVADAVGRGEVARLLGRGARRDALRDRRLVERRCRPAGRRAAPAAAGRACAPSAFSSAGVAATALRFTSPASSNSTATAIGRVEVVVHRRAERRGRAASIQSTAASLGRRRASSAV